MIALKQKLTWKNMLGNRSVKVERLIILILCAIIFSVLMYHLKYLTKFPPILVDESWYANAAWNLLKTGDNFDTMHAGARDNVIFPLIGNIPLSISFALSGLGLFQVRIITWIFGVLLLVALILVGYKNYGLATGVLAALILSLSHPFLNSSHAFRHDIMLAFMSVICFGLVLIAFNKEYWWAHFSSGLLISLSFDIHQNAIPFAIGLGCLYLFHYKKSIFKKPGTWIFILGIFLGILYYVVAIILPDPENFINFYRFSLGITHKMPISDWNINSIVQSLINELGRYHFSENNLDFVLLGASGFYLAIRRSKTDQLLLIFTTSIFLFFVLFVGNKEDSYAILLYPYFILMIAEAMISMLRINVVSLPTRVFISTLVSLLLLIYSVDLIRQTQSFQNYDYNETIQSLRTSIPEGEKVLGMPHWWIGLADYNYQSTNSLTFLHFIKGYSLTESMEVLHPDVIILDYELNTRLVEKDFYDERSFIGIYKLPRSEFIEFLERYGTKISSFYDPWHGYFEIYKINWVT